MQYSTFSVKVHWDSGTKFAIVTLYLIFVLVPVAAAATLLFAFSRAVPFKILSKLVNARAPSLVSIRQTALLLR